MKIFTLRADQGILEDTYRDKNQIVIKFKTGVDYVVTDNFAIQLKSVFKDKVVRFEDLVSGEHYKPYAGEPLDGKSLLTLRTGGIGDVIFVTPILRHLKAKYPTCTIGFSTEEIYASMVSVPFVDKVHGVIMKLSDIQSYDYVKLLESLIEGNLEAEEHNVYDLHAKAYAQSDITDFTPTLAINPKSLEFVTRFVNPKKFNIVLQYSASVPKRSVSPMLWAEFLKSFADENVTVWISDTPGNFGSVGSLVKHLSEVNPRLSVSSFADKTRNVSDLVALISMSDLVIGLDSSYVHIAAAFGKPMIGLYGAFPSELRMKYYKNAIGIDANSNCRFTEGKKFRCCFEHDSGPCRLAKINYQFYAPCMALLNAGHIRAAYSNIMQSVYGGSSKKQTTKIEGENS